MDFKLMQKFLALLLLVTSVGCVKGLKDLDGDYLIGEKVSNISSLQKSDGSDQSQVSIYDETTHKIHLFDLESMKYQKSFAVRNQTDKHYVVAHDEGNYYIDFSRKNVSVFASQGASTHKALVLIGEPTSAAFVSELNLLVAYDSMSNVGFLKLNSSGQVEKSLILGPLVSGNSMIYAGDLTREGKLILALSDSSIAIVDVAATLAAGEWVFTRFTTTLNRISWLAPVKGSPNLLFVRAETSLALIDLSTQTITSTVDISKYYVEKYSKNYDAHILLRANPLDYEMSSETILAFVEGGTIKTRNCVRKTGLFMSSYLNLAKNVWTFVDGDLREVISWNEINYVKTGRRVKSYRFSDMAATQDKPLQDKAQVQLSGDYVFSLFPSELGYATRTSLSKDDFKEARLFNMPHIKP